jgi:hypothetical protein
MFTGIGCFSLMTRTTTMKTRKLGRDRAFQKCRQGPRDGLARGAKVNTFEHLENLLSQRDQKLRRQGESDRWITT